jgi:hypothetical protein
MLQLVQAMQPLERTHQIALLTSLNVAVLHVSRSPNEDADYQGRALIRDVAAKPRATESPNRLGSTTLIDPSLNLNFQNCFLQTSISTNTGA